MKKDNKILLRIIFLDSFCFLSFCVLTVISIISKKYIFEKYAYYFLNLFVIVLIILFVLHVFVLKVEIPKKVKKPEVIPIDTKNYDEFIKKMIAVLEEFEYDNIKTYKYSKKEEIIFLSRRDAYYVPYNHLGTEFICAITKDNKLTQTNIDKIISNFNDYLGNIEIPRATYIFLAVIVCSDSKENHIRDLASRNLQKEGSYESVIINYDLYKKEIVLPTVDKYFTKKFKKYLEYMNR